MEDSAVRLESLGDHRSCVLIEWAQHRATQKPGSDFRNPFDSLVYCHGPIMADFTAVPPGRGRGHLLGTYDQPNG